MLQNCACIFVQSHADILTRPIQSTTLSQNLQEYLFEIICVAPVHVRLVGKRALYLFPAGWRTDSTKWPAPVCLKHSPGYRHSSRGGFWAGRDGFLPAAPLAETSLIWCFRAGTHTVGARCFSQPGVLLAQHDLRASTAKLSLTELRSQAKTSSFSNRAKELTENCL